MKLTSSLLKPLKLRRTGTGVRGVKFQGNPSPLKRISPLTPNIRFEEKEK